MPARRQRWGDLDPRTRRWIALLVPVQLGLLVTALLDLRRRSATELTGPKPVWVAVCFVNIVGPLTYFVFGRRRRPPDDMSR